MRGKNMRYLFKEENRVYEFFVGMCKRCEETAVKMGKYNQVCIDCSGADHYIKRMGYTGKEFFQAFKEGKFEKYPFPRKGVIKGSHGEVFPKDTIVDADYKCLSEKEPVLEPTLD